MNPQDTEFLGLAEGQQARVTTEAGGVEIDVEVTEMARSGQVIIPHGFGQTFEGETYGTNVNLLTGSTHRDPVAGTPHHRYVPCRVEGM